MGRRQLNNSKADLNNRSEMEGNDKALDGLGDEMGQYGEKCG
jgi:hypothetical protein